MKKLTVIIIFLCISLFSIKGQNFSVTPQIGGFTNFDYNGGAVVGIEAEYRFQKRFSISFGIQGLTDFDNEEVGISCPLLLNYYPIKNFDIKCGYDLLGWVPIGLSYDYKNFVIDIRYSIDVFEIEDSYLIPTIGYRLKF